MFRLRWVNSHLRRLLHAGAVNQDLVLEQLRVCCNEDQVFDVVGKNKAKLNVDHVTEAVGMLWQFQKQKADWQTLELTKSHPQFLTLRVLAENKIVLMDDSMLVDTLMCFHRLGVDPCDSLIQQLVSEAWLRLDKLPMNSLAMFSRVLRYQKLFHSPLMGQITNILAQRLEAVDSTRVLTHLMTSVHELVSPWFRDALIAKVDNLLDSASSSDSRRVLKFLHKEKNKYLPLIEKCNQIVLKNLPRMDADEITRVMKHNQLLYFFNLDFELAAKQRLTELIDSSTDPIFFTKVFTRLSPLASPEIRKRLEDTALLLADEFNAHQAVGIAIALGKVESRNLSLMNKIGGIIQKNLHVYRPKTVMLITKAFVRLQYQNPELYTKLWTILINFVQDSVFPDEVALSCRALSLLPSRVDESLISRIETAVPLCHLDDLIRIADVVAKWARTDASFRYDTPSKSARLLQVLNHYGQERLRTADRLDLLIEELRYANGEWFEEVLTEDVRMTLERMMDQINWTHVPALCNFLGKINLHSPTVMEHIANIVVKDIDKIRYSAVYEIFWAFSLVNIDSDKTKDMYNACIQHFTPHISSFDPCQLVLLGWSLAVADFFPEELIKEIFSIDFLGKLDSKLETLPYAKNLRIQLALMMLNRAVCLERPEFQVPWFHDRFCKRALKENQPANTLQQQIHRMLGEILGGMNFVKKGVVTPYFYTFDFECTLDKELKPVPYYNTPSSEQIPDTGQLRWGAESLSTMRNELPPGAQKVAVDFLYSKSFCKNSRHMNREALVRKRHLEILGYCVVQIPHFEWNSMELSTQDAWKDYLKKKIFSEFSTS